MFGLHLHFGQFLHHISLETIFQFWPTLIVQPIDQKLWAPLVYTMQNQKSLVIVSAGHRKFKLYSATANSAK